MPTQQEINMYDMNFDGVLDDRDIQLAEQMGMGSVASAIRNILGGKAADLQMGTAMEEITTAPTGEELKGMITESKELGGEFLTQDIDPSLLTANPMPSLPSISNVGAVPFSGSINWNAIPGGFQPLPQVAGGRKKLYQLSKFHAGINQKSSPRDISDEECQEAKNITVSQVGRIKLLGDIKSTSSAITSTTLSDNGVPSPGYGLFIFKSGYSLASSPVQGNYIINVSQDGAISQLVDNSGTPQTSTLRISDENTHVAPTFYAAGNGLYACNANLENNDHVNDTRKAAILVYRKDYFSAGVTDRTTNVWVTGEALINSPTYDEAATDGAVNLEWDDIGAGSDVSFARTTTNGSATVHIGSDADISGNWNGSYHFYISWLFDNGCETGLTSLIKTGATVSAGTGVNYVPTFSDESLEFNFSVMDDDGSRNYIGGDARIHGARVYFRKVGNVQRHLLAEISVVDGVKGALDDNFIPWAITTNTFDLADNITFESPPEIYTYVALNGYYANEMYDESPETLADGTAGPAAHDVRYRTSTVGSNGAVFIGAFMFKNKVFTDGMMYSMPNKPGVFPELNVFDSPSSDGTPITALVSFKDKVLQFKENAMYAINISNSSQFYTEASFRDCGIHNPCQAFQTPFGVIFANKFGCFIYDGKKVISLTNGKFNRDDWDLDDDTVVDASSSALKDSANVPCVGYDPRTQSIIVLKDIGDDSTNTGAWVYSMTTQSWTEGSEMLTNADGDRHTNFAISPNGYLSIQEDGEEGLKTYNAGVANSSVQKVLYQTKDLDFGMPSQTKKLFKVYVTYKGNPSNLVLTWRANGSATDYGFTATNWDDAGTTDYEIATFVPDSTSEAKDWKSMSLRFDSGSNTVATDLEINDISILYRARPIK